MTLLRSACQRLDMETGHARVQVTYRTLEEFEGGFSDRVSSLAVFFAEHQVVQPLAGTSVELGARVDVVVVLADGTVAFAVRGVVAWAWREASLPLGREAGLGVMLLDVIDGIECFHRLVARPGSGSRVRIPGARLMQRLVPSSPMSTGIVMGPLQAPSLVSATATATATTSLPTATGLAAINNQVDDRHGMTLSVDVGAVIADALDDRAVDGGFADEVVLHAGAATPLASRATDTSARLAVLTAALAGLGEGSYGPTIDGPEHPDAQLDGLEPFTHLESLADPSTWNASKQGSSLLSGRDSTLSALHDERPEFPSNLDDAFFALDDSDKGSANPVRPVNHGTVPVMLDLSDVSAFPDSIPALGRSFDAQSTDVDLLALVSAGDVIALDVMSNADETPAAGMGFTIVTPTDSGEDGGDDLPSVEADLVNLDDLSTGETSAEPVLATAIVSSRPLPVVEHWAGWPMLVDDRIVGASFSLSKRGVLGLEYFSWPRTATKRYSGQGHGDHDDPRRQRTVIVPIVDGLDDLDDSHSDSGDGDVFSAPSVPEADPFEAQGTDPRLNVEGLVARHLRATHADIDDDLVVFDVLNSVDRGDPDATRDELVLPGVRPSAFGVLVESTSGTDSGEAADSSEPDRT
jgi:hypothetical protein